MAAQARNKPRKLTRPHPWSPWRPKRHHGASRVESREEFWGPTPAIRLFGSPVQHSTSLPVPPTCATHTRQQRRGPWCTTTAPSHRAYPETAPRIPWSPCSYASRLRPQRYELANHRHPVDRPVRSPRLRHLRSDRCDSLTRRAATCLARIRHRLARQLEPAIRRAAVVDPVHSATRKDESRHIALPYPSARSFSIASLAPLPTTTTHPCSASLLCQTFCSSLTLPPFTRFISSAT